MIYRLSDGMSIVPCEKGNLLTTEENCRVDGDRKINSCCKSVRYRTESDIQYGKNDYISYKTWNGLLNLHSKYW